MAYDRYDTRDGPRERDSRWTGDRHEGRNRGEREDRGFFQRAGDEIASWFGDEDSDRDRGFRDDRERDRERGGWFGNDRDDERRPREERFGGRRSWASSERDYNPSWREMSGGRDRDPRDRDYRPMTGDYGRSEQFFAASGAPRGGFGRGDDDRSRYERSQSPWGRDEYRRTSFAGSSDRSHHDPQYHSWREQQMSELDRDYDEYRRENQSRFEDDFKGWRERRQQKRGLLGQIREHMEVVGNDDEHVGTVDKVAGDRIILTKSDPESGGIHHSLSCSKIDRIENDRVILDCSGEKARQNWRDETHSRALFERQDQGETGPRMLDRSFEGTYR